jgi:hypothetical protein
MALRLFVASTALLMAGVAPVEVLAQEVGRVGAVNPRSQGTPPGRSQRVLDLGLDVIFKERIQTSREGSVSVAFVDKSTVGLGPDTDVVLDEYFYDPKVKTGTMLMNLGKGMLRFVGGEISHRGTVEVRTPVGTVGVRGGAFTVIYDPATRTLRVISTYGRLTISNGLGTQRIDRPGFVVVVAAGQAPAAPVRSGSGDFDLPTRLIGSQPGQFGSAPRLPTDQGTRTAYVNPTTAAPPSTVASLSGNASQASSGSRPPGGARPVTSLAGAQAVQTAVSQQAALTTAVTDQAALGRTRTAGAAAVAAALDALALATQSQAAAATLAASASVAAANASTDPNAAVSRTAALSAAAAAQAALAQANADLAQAGAALAQAQALLANLQAAGNLLQARPAVTQLVAATNAVLSAVRAVQGQAAVVQARALDVTALVSASFDAARLVPARSFALAGSATAGSAIPFLTDVFVSEANSLNATVTPMLGHRVRGDVSPDGFIVTPGVIRTLQIGFSLTGSGASQSSSAMVATGGFVDGQPGTGNGLDFVGGFFASGRVTATDGPSFARGSLAGANGSITLEPDDVPATGSLDSTSTAGGLAGPGGALQFGYLTGNTTPAYDYVQPLGGEAPPPGLGDDRDALTLRGYVSGSMTSTQLGSPPGANGLPPLLAATRQDFQFAGLGGTPDDVTLIVDPVASTVQGTLKIRSLDPASRLASAIYQLGSDASSAATQRSAFIDNQTFALRSAGGTSATVSLRNGTIETVSGGNRQFLFPWSAVRAGNPGADAQYFPGVAMCGCSYTQWGFWSVDGTRGSDSDYGNLNPWVAGQLGSIGQIPNSGSATYAGHAVASINNAGSVYIAAGNFSHAVNFATQSGTGTISNLDGRTYAVTSALTAGTVQFSGAIAGTNAAGSMRGSFYGPGTPPLEMGGQFGIASTGGPAYAANGVFLGAR